MTTTAPRLIDYPSIQWNADWCKRCYICVEACPRQALELKDESNIKINAACPGWVKTELGGPDAIYTVEEGADTPLWLATLPDDGPSGGLFRQREPYPW